MLTFPFGTAVVSGALAEFGTTGDFDVAAYAYIPTICTSFDHDAGQTTFTGTVTMPGAFLYGEAFSSGTLVTTLSFTDETGAPLTFNVVSATFDTVASTGQAVLLGTITDVMLDEHSVSTIIAGLTLDLSLVGTTGVFGDVDGSIELLPISTIINLDSRPFSLTVGAVCS